LYHIFILILLAFALFTGTATHANVYQRLTSGDTLQIKLAAQDMTVGKEITQINTDVLAEILSSRYQDEENTRRELDMLAWVCKALGESKNGRYLLLLTEIRESDAYYKLRKYAKKAMKKLIVSDQESFEKGQINLNALMREEKLRQIKAEIILPRADLTRTENKLFSIAMADLTVIKALSSGIKKRKKGDREVLDTLMEFLLANYKTAASYQVDTLSWICRAIEATKEGRYLTAMKQVYNGTNSKKLRSYAWGSYVDLPESTHYYEKGMVNLPELINQYKIKLD